MHPQPAVACVVVCAVFAGSAGFAAVGFAGAAAKYLPFLVHSYLTSFLVQDEQSLVA